MVSPADTTSKASPCARKAAGLPAPLSSKPTKVNGRGGAFGGGGGGGATTAGAGGGGGANEVATKGSAVAANGISARAADDKKGEAITVLDVGEIIGIVDTFVITSGSNTRMVRSIVDEVEKQLQEQAGIKPRSMEGLDDYSWVLLDYGDLVVHVFLDETREYYGLERLWADAGRIEWNAAAVEPPV